MEDDVFYSIVIRKSPPPPHENEEDKTIYSIPTGVEPPPAAPVKAEPEAAEVHAAPRSHSHLLLVCLVILCVLLVGSIAAIVYLGVTMNSQQTEINNLIMEKRNLQNQTDQLAVENGNLENLTNLLMVEKINLENLTDQLILKNLNLENLTEHLMVENGYLENKTEQLMVENGNLENQTEQLTRNRDDLNWTLGVILTFNTFPVNNFCPNKKCQPCQTGWIQFQGNCYLFYNVTPWMTWTQSRQYCQSQSADLVVINNLEEQTFVSNNAGYYWDQWHGYWLGLQQINNIWTWVDGHEDTLRYWIPQTYGSSGPFALLVPNPYNKAPIVTQNWGSAVGAFQARFICEQAALIRSN